MTQYFKSRVLTCALIRKKILETTKPLDGETYVMNRNPRNLEKLRIAHKPVGYHLDRKGRSFWYKLEVMPTNKFVSAHVRHFEDGPVVMASTEEWPIKKQLYKTNDTSAYINLARVLAQRCLECGIIEMTCNIEPQKGTKMDKFLKTFEENGISLSEPEQFQPQRPWDVDRPEKPWEVVE